MNQTLHIAVEIDFLQSLTDKQLEDTVTQKDGTKLTVKEIRAQLMAMRAGGFLYLPTCDDYDEKGKCVGHTKKTGNQS